MIAYLKKNQYGRATFLPLSAVSGKNNRRDNLERESGFIGYANELVKVDLQYKGLADYLLGRCVVVDNIDNALHLNKAHGYSLKIVTLEGELLNPGGSMTGGAFRNSSNLLGRRREIEELEKVVSSTEKVIFHYLRILTGWVDLLMKQLIRLQKIQRLFRIKNLQRILWRLITIS